MPATERGSGYVPFDEQRPLWPKVTLTEKFDIHKYCITVAQLEKSHTVNSLSDFSYTAIFS